MLHLVKLELLDDRSNLVGTAVISATAAVGFRLNVERWASFDDLIPIGAKPLERMLNEELATLKVGDTVDDREHPELMHVLAEAFHHRRLTPIVVNTQSRDQQGWTSRVLRGRHYDPWLATGHPMETRDGETPPDAAGYVHARFHSIDRWAIVTRNREAGAWEVRTGPNRDEEGAAVATVDSLFDAMDFADRLVHPECKGEGCGEWRPLRVASGS